MICSSPSSLIRASQPFRLFPCRELELCAFHHHKAGHWLLVMVLPALGADDRVTTITRLGIKASRLSFIFALYSPGTGLPHTESYVFISPGRCVGWALSVLGRGGSMALGMMTCPGHLTEFPMLGSGPMSKERRVYL